MVNDTMVVWEEPNIEPVLCLFEELIKIYKINQYLHNGKRCEHHILMGTM